MDSFELNKVAGAVLFAVLVSFGLSILSETLFETEAPEQPAYVIAVAEPAEGEADAGAAEAQPIGVLLASADAGAGEASAKKCGACHSFGEGEANKVGPNLYGVVNRAVAGHAGYEYSEALRAYAASEPTWTFDALNAFLLDPKGAAPGTKMAFAGLKNDPERANVIAYLRGLAAEPAPLPEAEAAPAEDAAPAEGEAAAPSEGETGAAAEPTEPAEAPTEQAAAGEAAEVGGPEPAPEAPAESGQGGGASAQPQGSLGGVDSVPADQQGAVPQVAPIEQPAPEPPAEEAAAPAQPAAGTAEPAPATAPEAGTVETAPAADTPPDGAVAAAPPPDAAGDAGQPAQPTVAQAAPEAAPLPADTAAAPPAEASAPPAPAAGGAFATAVAAADPAKGQGLAKRCAACHGFTKDAPNKIGPKLWGVVDRPIASVPDYPYSEAMKAHSEGGAKAWTYDELDAYLENPKAHVPGNKMAFPGLKKPDERASVVAYLRSLSDSPAPAP